MEESRGEGGEDSVLTGDEVVARVEWKMLGRLAEVSLKFASKANEGEEDSWHRRV